MIRQSVFVAVVTALSGLPGFARAQGTVAPSKSPTTHAFVTALPLSFEPNQGQLDPQIQFLAQGPGYRLSLTTSEAVFAFNRADTDRSTVRMKLIGTTGAPTITAAKPLAGRIHYIHGNDPRKWHSNIPTYAEVKYRDVYPGVDLVYYGKSGQLEYDFVIAPEADPAVIAVGFDGVDRLDVNSAGDLVLWTRGASLRFQKPTVYQNIDGVRQHVTGNFALLEPHRVGFRVGAYDRTRELVIDPVLSYATYIGDESDAQVHGIAVDTNGAVYITGRTAPLGGSATNATDAFVSKIGSDGSTLIYSTYLAGSLYDSGEGIAVDRAGVAYIAGATHSPDFPTLHALQPALAPGVGDDAFLVKLTPDGSGLVYGTYLGGTQDDWAAGVAVDSVGNTYLVGLTRSADFPSMHALQGFSGVTDVFVTKLNPDGSALVYSTWLGGSDQEEGISSIAIDPTGAAYVAGATTSFDFPVVHAVQPTYHGSFGFATQGDGFVAKLAADGASLVYSTYLGGASRDVVTGIAIDSAGAALVTGFTFSTDFPTARALQSALNGRSDAFVTKLAPDGDAIVYSTYLGGSADGGTLGDDGSRGIATDANGNAYITGFTDSTDFPIKGASQVTNAGENDGFVAELTSEGDALVFGTYLGGSDHDFGWSIALDRLGNVYVTGLTFSSDFPVVNPLQSTPGDTFVAKYRTTDQYFEIVSRNSGKCLDVRGASPDPVAQIIQWTCHGGESQQWQIEPASDGAFRIVARHSGQALDVYGALLNDVIPVIQYPWHGGDNQLWTVEPTPEGYVFIVARHSGKVLDVEYASLDDGAEVIQYSSHGGANQQWLLHAVAADPIAAVQSR